VASVGRAVGCGRWTAADAGKMLNAVVPVSVGATVIRDQFVFADLIAS
jgi:hypothetical protein